MLVAVQLFVPGLYLPPVLTELDYSSAAPDDHLDCRSTPQCGALAPSGALVVLVAVQVFAAGLYLPTGVYSDYQTSSSPPHTIISLPVQIAV